MTYTLRDGMAARAVPQVAPLFVRFWPERGGEVRVLLLPDDDRPVPVSGDLDVGVETTGGAERGARILVPPGTRARDLHATLTDRLRLDPLTSWLGDMVPPADVGVPRAVAVDASGCTFPGGLVTLDPVASCAYRLSTPGATEGSTTTVRITVGTVTRSLTVRDGDLLLVDRGPAWEPSPRVRAMPSPGDAAALWGLSRLASVDASLAMSETLIGRLPSAGLDVTICAAHAILRLRRLWVHVDAVDRALSAFDDVDAVVMRWVIAFERGGDAHGMLSALADVTTRLRRRRIAHSDTLRALFERVGVWRHLEPPLPRTLAEASPKHHGRVRTS